MFNPVPRPQMGAYSELLACAHLLAKGLQVFRNVAAHGPADLITLDPVTGETIKWDVKSCRGISGGQTSPSDAQMKIGVRLLHVNPDTHFVSEDIELVRANARATIYGERVCA